MATLVKVKNLSRRRLRFNTVTVQPASPTGTGAVAQIDIDDPTTRRDLYRNLGSYSFAPDVLVAKVALVVAAFNTAAGAFAWQNPEALPIFVHRAVLDITTAGAATSTIDVGSTATANGAADVTNIFSAQATSSSATVISNNVARLGATDWVSGTYKTATPTNLVANIYLHYSLI